MIVSMVVLAWVAAAVVAIRAAARRYLPVVGEWIRDRVTRTPEISPEDEARIVARLKALASDDGGVS